MGCDISMSVPIKFRIWMRYLDVPKLVISHDMGYYITIDRDMSCDITPDHHKTPGKNDFFENGSPCCGLRFALKPCLCSFLVLSSACSLLSSFCCPSDGHITGLIVPPANTNLIPPRLGLLPQCIIVFVSFLCFLSFLASFSFLLYTSK